MKYANLVAARENLAGEDFYYLGMLHWLTENGERAAEALTKFLAEENPEAEKAQTARSIIVIVSARNKNFAEAEKILAQYIKNEPVKYGRTRQNGNRTGQSYHAEKQFERAAPHAEEAYRATKAIFNEFTSRVDAINRLLTAGIFVFETYRDQENRKKPKMHLSNLRKKP